MNKLALFRYRPIAMGKIKRSIFACFIFLIGVYPSKLVAQNSEFGVNLSGMEWNSGVGTVGTTYFEPTQAEFTYYASKGLKLVRIPFLWERMQPTLGGALNATYLAQLDQVVGYAANAGVSVFIDCHNYARYPYNGNVITSGGGPTQANFNNLWTQLATHYASNTTVWGYDIMNEPNTLGGINWMTIAQATITAIRTVDQTHVIIIEGDNWSHGNTWTTYNNTYNTLTDPNNNLVFEAHQYFDNNYSGAYSNNTMAGNGDNVNTGVTLITPFVNWVKTNNVRGMVGEYGIPNNADQANWNTLLTNFLAYLQTNCILGTYWAGGPDWGTYLLSCEPTNNFTTDAPQMAVLDQYTNFVSGCSPITPQPITLSSFSLSQDNSAVSLYWTTASETNNDYFTIQRSGDGFSFEGIGQVKGNGTTTAIHNYSFTDLNPLSGTAYYRLAQSDYNGDVTYSKEVSTTLGSKIQVVVAPNPFSNVANLIVTGGPQELVQLKILDLTGKTKYSGCNSANEGIIFGNGLNPGLYLLQVQINDQLFVQKIVKQ